MWKSDQPRVMLTALPLVAALLGLTACRGATRAEDDPRICQQTYEFGNYGCARVVAVVEALASPFPSAYRYQVTARPAGTSSAGLTVYAESPRAGPNLLKFILYTQLLPVGTDTASVWIIGRVFDRTNAAGNAPLPTFAADSVLHLLRFSPVGSPAIVDTVRLVLPRTP